MIHFLIKALGDKYNVVVDNDDQATEYVFRGAQISYLSPVDLTIAAIIKENAPANKELDKQLERLSSIIQKMCTSKLQPQYKVGDSIATTPTPTSVVGNSHDGEGSNANVLLHSTSSSMHKNVKKEDEKKRKLEKRSLNLLTPCYVNVI